MSNPYSLFHQSTQQEICQNLTFEEAISLREALGTAGLNCLIPANDSDNQIKYLKGVNPTTVQIYSAIKEHGSIFALSTASYANDLELIKLLLDAGVNVDAAKPPSYTTSLMIAAGNNNVDLIRLLLERGADVNKRSGSGATPLLIAAEKGKLEAFQELINTGADIHVRNNFGQTLLMRAVAGKNNQIVQLILDTNPDLLAQDQNGDNAMIWALHLRNAEALRLISQKLTGEAIRNVTIETENL